MKEKPKTAISKFVVLFDIDGTLVTGPTGAASAGFVAMIRAAAAVTGQEVSTSGADFAGRTDLQISRMLLEAAGETDPRPEMVAALVDRYVEFLAQEIRQNPYTALGSPAQAIRALTEIGAISALGTGNVRRGSAIKLKNAGIGDLFDIRIGGFGEDGETRSEVLAKGVKSCDPSGSLPVVVVGDTPRDVEAAHQIGAVCIGIPYRRNDAKTLLSAGADAISTAVDAGLVPIVEDLLSPRASEPD